MSQTELEKCFEIIMKAFWTYSIREEPRDMLSKGEFGKLVEEQLPNFLLAIRTPEATNALFEELDQNKDGQMSFQEFTTLINKVLMDTNAPFQPDH